MLYLTIGSIVTWLLIFIWTLGMMRRQRRIEGQIEELRQRIPAP